MRSRPLAAIALVALGVAVPCRAEPKPGANAPPAPKTSPPPAAPAAGVEETPSAAPTPSSGTTDTAAPAAATTAPGSSAPAPSGTAAPTGTDTGTAPPPPPGGPPPQYYVEPQPGHAEAPPEGIYEPPPPASLYEPPPPAPPRSRAPQNALWVGARVSWFVPFGSLWIDGFSGPSGQYFRRRTFASYASSGPAGEIDVGARLTRHYMIFAIVDHASLGSGSLEEHSFGGQNRGYTNFYGAGLRFSTDPGNVGFVLEIALGYREFHAKWADGTELSMTGGAPDARLGLGADIRLSRLFSLSPMIALGGGSFGSGRFTGPSGAHDIQTAEDSQGEYGTLAIQVGGHFDVY